jgi:hypothetical protein
MMQNEYVGGALANLFDRVLLIIVPLGLLDLPGCRSIDCGFGCLD